MDEKITSRYFDIGRGEIGRITRIYCLSRLLPLGNLAGFSHLRQLVILLVTHRLGGPIFRLLIPHEDRLTRLYRRVKGR